MECHKATTRKSEINGKVVQVRRDQVTYSRPPGGKGGSQTERVMGSDIGILKPLCTKLCIPSQVSSSVSLTNTTVSNNSAGTHGGGIYARTSSSVSLTNSTVSNNSAVLGGGIYADGSSVALVNSIVSGNNATAVGDSGKNNAISFSNFSPGASDITATSDGFQFYCIGVNPRPASG